MMKKYRAGFVVGKFLPFHMGHELLINTALDQCDVVYVYTYTSINRPFCSNAERVAWLQHAFEQFVKTDRLVVFTTNYAPHDDEPEARHRQHCADVMLSRYVQIDAVFSSEKYGDPLAAVFENTYLSRFGWRHPVEHVCVDIAREQCPISGTQLRSGEASPLKWCSFRVAMAFNPPPRVAVLGGESSGKTTLVDDLKRELLNKGLNPAVVPEVGRLLGYDINQRYRLQDMDTICDLHTATEDGSNHYSKDVILCDTTPLVTMWYSERWYNAVSANVLKAVRNRPYDLYFLCNPNIPYEQDGTRENEQFRQEGFMYQRRYLEAANILYVQLTGTREQRTFVALAHITELLRTRNRSL